MIKLIAVPQPEELTLDVIQDVTNKYIQTKEFDLPDQIRKVIIKSFQKMFNIDDPTNKVKCCYCECEVNVAGSDLHIDHFYPKDKYKNDVLNWDNLLPCCIRCNRHKGTLDTKRVSIVHPIRNNPKKHIELKSFLLVGKDELGEFTIERLNLNDEDKLITDRFLLGAQIIKRLKKLKQDLLEKFKEKHLLTIKKQTQYSNELQHIMEYGIAKKKYSAVISTTILTNDDYKEIKQLFMKHNLWTDELIDLEQEVEFCALI